MRLYLNVPYKEKDQANKCGAFWDANKKKWYVSQFKKISELNKWMEVNKCNIICKNLYILKMKSKCYSCKKDIEVIALATNDCYIQENGYAHNTNMQILRFIEDVPMKLEQILLRFNMIKKYTKTSKISYYVNNCISCKKSNGDFFIHERPSTSFYQVLCYKNSMLEYYEIENDELIPLYAELPYYDMNIEERSILFHMETGIENYASMGINQYKVNQILIPEKCKGDVKFLGKIKY